MTTIGTTTEARAPSNRTTEALGRIVRRLRALAPQLALVLVVPGGFVLALLLWLRKRNEKNLHRDTLLRVGRYRGMPSAGCAAKRLSSQGHGSMHATNTATEQMER